KEAAMTAGIDHANGDAVILLDADLQDPPELIPKMIASWGQGFDMVCMQRTSRDGESFRKKFTARAFYTLMGRVGGIQVPENVGDFRLMSRPVVDALKCLPERTRFMKGLFAWVGFKTCILPYHRDARYAGTSKWNYWRLWNFALEGFTSFTVAPLKIASYTGFMTALIALGYAVFVISKALIYGDPVPGYPSLMVVVLFLGGLQLIALGVIGEYLGRMFIESKHRPLYLLKNKHQVADNHIDSVSITPHFPIVKEILNQ
ncbi:MAG: glycosyltransferase, partial [Candidatus Marinimicrobia bacterium]|nr:glycosyltransferase [Candidatus Neomarinimicrobiota bacterium]